MPAIDRRRAPLEETLSQLATPRLKTLVCGSFKGGSWKTSIAVATAERLAWTGRHLLLISADPQRDARQRLGVTAKNATGPAVRVPAGDGSVTVVAASSDHLVSLLYEQGPEAFGLGSYDAAIVDMPPTEEGGWLPGAFLVVPLVDQNAILNCATMLGGTPSTTSILLVRVKDQDATTWNKKASAIEKAIGRPLGWVPDPIPSAAPIEAAHAAGQSVWTLPRRGHTKAFLDAIEQISDSFWEHMYGPGHELPAMQRWEGTAPLYVKGWSRG